MASALDVEQGLHRTTRAYPNAEEAFPAGVLVYVGRPKNGGFPFMVRPGRNEHNVWYWGEPTTPLDDPSWARTLIRLPNEGFYTLPRDLELEQGGRWLQNAIVQLGYNPSGRGIAFVAERHRDEDRNVLIFSERGVMLEDELLFALRWAPILPVPSR